MNLTELDNLCKKRSREVLNSAKDALANHPFIDVKINQGMIDDCINFQINQVLGSKIQKDFIKTNKVENSIQFQIIDKRIKFYKYHVIKEFNKFANQIINT